MKVIDHLWLCPNSNQATMHTCFMMDLMGGLQSLPARPNPSAKIVFLIGCKAQFQGMNVQVCEGRKFLASACGGPNILWKDVCIAVCKTASSSSSPSMKSKGDDDNFASSSSDAVQRFLPSHFVSLSPLFLESNKEPAWRERDRSSLSQLSSLSLSPFVRNGSLRTFCDASKKQIVPVCLCQETSWSQSGPWLIEHVSGMASI